MKNGPTSFDYQKRGMDLTKTQFDIVNNGPNQSQPFIEAVDDFSKINQKRKNPLQAGIEGVASGLKYGAKRGEVDRKQQLFDFLEGNIMAMREKSDYLEKQKLELENATPYATALYDISNSKHLSDDDKQRYTADLVKQYQQVNPEAGKFDVISTPAGQDFFVALDRTTGEKSIKTYQSMMTPDAWGDLQKRNLENLKVGIQQQNADAYGKSVNSTVDLHKAQIDKINNTPPNIPVDHYDVEFDKGLAKKALDIIDHIPKDTRQLASLKEAVFGMEDALNKGAFTNDGAIKSSVRKWFGEKLGTEGFIATQNFDTSAKSFLTSIKETFGGRITDADLRIAMQYMIPGQSWSKETINKFLGEVKHVIADKEKGLREIDSLIKENGGKLPRDYVAKISQIENLDAQDQRHKEEKLKQQGAVPSSNAPQGGQIKVKAPDGQIWNFTKEQYNTLPTDIKSSLILQ